MKKILDVKVEAEKFFRLADKYARLVGKSAIEGIREGARAFALSAAKETPVAKKSSRSLIQLTRPGKREQVRYVVRMQSKRGRRIRKMYFARRSDATSHAKLTNRGITRAAWLLTLQNLGYPMPARMSGITPTAEVNASAHHMNTTFSRMDPKNPAITVEIHSESVAPGRLRIAAARGYRTAAVRMRWAIKKAR